MSLDAECGSIVLRGILHSIRVNSALEKKFIKSHLQRQAARTIVRPTFDPISVLEGEAMHLPNLKFAHRFVPDGTVESICPRCFVTLASSKNEPDLAVKEQHHVCDPFLLSHYEFFKKEPRSETVSEQVSRDQKRHS